MFVYDASKQTYYTIGDSEGCTQYEKIKTLSQIDAINSEICELLQYKTVLSDT